MTGSAGAGSARTGSSATGSPATGSAAAGASAAGAGSSSNLDFLFGRLGRRLGPRRRLGDDLRGGLLGLGRLGDDLDSRLLDRGRRGDDLDSRLPGRGRLGGDLDSRLLGRGRLGDDLGGRLLGRGRLGDDLGGRLLGRGRIGDRRGLGFHDDLWSGRLRLLVADLQPDVVAAPGGNDDERALQGRVGRNLVLDRPEVGELGTLVGWQQLVHHGQDGLGREAPARQLDLAPREGPTEGIPQLGRRHDVRLLADVHDDRVALEADDGAEQGFYERHGWLSWRMDKSNGDAPTPIMCRPEPIGPLGPI